MNEFRIDIGKTDAITGNRIYPREVIEKEIDSLSSGQKISSAQKRYGYSKQNVSALNIMVKAIQSPGSSILVYSPSKTSEERIFDIIQNNLPKGSYSINVTDSCYSLRLKNGSLIKGRTWPKK